MFHKNSLNSMHGKSDSVEFSGIQKRKERGMISASLNLHDEIETLICILLFDDQGGILPSSLAV